MIIKHNDIIEKILHYHKTGGGNVFYFGFKNLAQFYSIKEGGCTDWTGYAGSGKTELLLEGLTNCSQWYGHKHLINMPDAGSNEEIIGKLLHKISGKQFEEFYYNKDGWKCHVENRITEKEIYRYLPDVLEYFKIYNPKQKSKGTTPKEFWDYAAKNKKELGIFSAVIDSWNYMKHDTEGFSREDKWLEHTLSYRNELAESSGLHFHTIIHPKTEKKNKEGKTVCPDMHSLKGGSEWSNNGKTIIVVHRDFGSNITQIRIEKAKPKIVGVQGNTVLQYDIKAGKFFEASIEIGFGEPVKNYAAKSVETNQEVKQEIQPNTNFYEPKVRESSPF